MSVIAIVGAGELGGATAHVLAQHDAADLVRLVDESGRVAEGKALDIMQAAAIEGFATEVTGSAELMAAGGADIVIVADRHAAGEWQGEEGVALLVRIAGVAPRAVIICAGASQRDLVDAGVRERRMDRRRIFGSAPEALASGARALIALVVNGSPQDVAVSLLGRPPDQIVIPWEQATVGGYQLPRVVTEPARRRLAGQIAATWPPGHHALAAAAFKAVDAVTGRTRSVICGFAAPDDAEGRRAHTVALPLRVGPGGIETMELPPLSVVDRVALDNAMLL